MNVLTDQMSEETREAVFEMISVIDDELTRLELE